MASIEELDFLNRRATDDPRGLLAQGDSDLYNRLAMATAKIVDRMSTHPIVLLSGPSGSGKTTTARKLEAGLSLLGVKGHVISLDDYYLDVTPETHPLNAFGVPDYETPDILDLAMLRDHFKSLCSGGEVLVPSFDFASQKRDPNGFSPLRLGKDEVAIFEGIHALNPSLLDPSASATRIYVTSHNNILNDGSIYFKCTWTRLIRRLIRDENFRGQAPDGTLRLWAGLRRGEKKYISPYKESADIVINTSLGYELCALRDLALARFKDVPTDLERYAELCEIGPRLSEFAPIPVSYLSKKSLLREFIGGIIF